MIEDKIVMATIQGIIDAGRKILGDDAATKAAAEVEGLDVMSGGGIAVTGDGLKIISELCKAYEKAVQGKIMVDIEVRLNLKR